MGNLLVEFVLVYFDVSVFILSQYLIYPSLRYMRQTHYVARVFWDVALMAWNLLSRPGWPQTCSNSPASAPRVLGSQASLSYCVQLLVLRQSPLIKPRLASKGNPPASASPVLSFKNMYHQALQFSVEFLKKTSLCWQMDRIIFIAVDASYHIGLWKCPGHREEISLYL